MFTVNADEAEMTVVASEVAPWPDELRSLYPDPAPGEHAISFDVDCDDPVSVTLAGGLDAGISGTLYAYTGAGVSVPVATGYVGLNHQRDFTAPDVSFRFVSSPEAGATRIALRHPSGEASWALTTPLTNQTAGIDGGPGPYASPSIELPPSASSAPSSPSSIP